MLSVAGNGADFASVGIQNSYALKTGSRAVDIRFSLGRIGVHSESRNWLWIVKSLCAKVVEVNYSLEGVDGGSLGGEGPNNYYIVSGFKYGTVEKVSAGLTQMYGISRKDGDCGGGVII